MMFPGILAGNSLAQSRSTGEVVPAAPGQQPRCAACSSPSPPAWLAFLAGWSQHDPGLGTATAGPHGAAASRGERGASPSRSTRWCCKTALLPGLHRLVPAVTAWPGPRESHRGPARAGPTAGRLAGHPGGDMAPAVPQERSVPTSGLFTLFLVPARSRDEVSRHLHRYRHLRTSALPSSQFGPCSCQAGSAQVAGAQSCSKYAGGVPQGQTQSPVFAGDLSALRGAQSHPSHGAAESAGSTSSSPCSGTGVPCSSLPMAESHSPTPPC